MKALLSALIAIAAISLMPSSNAQDIKTYIPKPALELCPKLMATQEQIWKSAPTPAFLCAQVEKESCITLKHSKCWNPQSQLKTSREWGFGLGQTTIAYRADGSVRFNKQQELRDQYASLRNWSDDKKFDVEYQITAIVEMNKGIYNRVTDADSETDQLAFTLSSYNGGESGVRQDRLLCKNTKGCNYRIWFKNVELYSLKTRKVNKGYGASAFDINRAYVKSVFYRRQKYEIFFKK